MNTYLSDVCDSYGVLLRRDAVERGISDNALARLVKAGVLRRQRQGAYVLEATYRAADDVTRHRMLCRAVTRQYDEHVALSHASSCVVQGGPTWGLDLDAVHLTHLVGGGRRESRIVHHHAECRVDDLRRHEGGWVTSPGRAVLEVAATLGVEAGLVQANHFLHEGHTTSDQLAQMAARTERWAGTLGHRILLRLADARIESVLESRGCYLMYVQGVPRPVPQYEVRDSAGRLIGRVDFAWPEKRVLVEFDGLSKYHRYRRPGESIEDAVIREKLREDDLRAAGWTVIRLTWRDLDFPIATAARICRALG